MLTVFVMVHRAALRKLRGRDPVVPVGRLLGAAQLDALRRFRFLNECGRCGKGFQGAIKRHGLSRGPMKHGSKYHRHAGSNGAATSPGRVFKGKHMPGQTGNVKVTVQNLEVVRVDLDNNVILVKGAVPGPKKAVVVLKETVKKAN